MQRCRLEAVSAHVSVRPEQRWLPTTALRLINLWAIFGWEALRQAEVYILEADMALFAEEAMRSPTPIWTAE